VRPATEWMFCCVAPALSTQYKGITGRPVQGYPPIMLHFGAEPAPESSVARFYAAIRLLRHSLTESLETASTHKGLCSQKTHWIDSRSLAGLTLSACARATMFNNPIFRSPRSTPPT
jgi:hypothetical protein